MKLGFPDISFFISVLLYFNKHILCESSEKVLLDLSDSSDVSSQVKQFASIITESLEEVENHLREDGVAKVTYEIKPPRNANSSLSTILMKTLKETIAKVAPSLQYTITSGFVSELNEDDHEIKLLEYDATFTKNENADRKQVLDASTYRMDKDSLNIVFGQNPEAYNMNIRFPPNTDNDLASKVRKALNDLLLKRQKLANERKLNNTPRVYTHRYTPENKVKQVATSFKTTEFPGNRKKSEIPESTETYQNVYQNSPSESEILESTEIVGDENDYQYSSSQKEITRDDELSARANRQFEDQNSSSEQETTQDKKLLANANRSVDHQYSKRKQIIFRDGRLRSRTNRRLDDQYSSGEQETTQDDKLTAREKHRFNDHNTKRQQKITRDGRQPARSNHPKNVQYKTFKSTRGGRIPVIPNRLNNQYSSGKQKTTQDEKLRASEKHPISDQQSKRMQKTTRGGRLPARADSPLDEPYPSVQQAKNQDENLPAREKQPIYDQKSKRRQKASRGGRLPARAYSPLHEPYLSVQQANNQDENLPAREKQPIYDQKSKRRQKASRGGRLPARSDSPLDEPYPIVQQAKNQDENLPAREKQPIYDQKSKRRQKTTGGGRFSARSDGPLYEPYSSVEQEINSDESSQESPNHLIDDQYSKLQSETNRRVGSPPRSDDPLDESYSSVQQETNPDESLTARRNSPYDYKYSKRPTRYYRKFSDQYSRGQQDKRPVGRSSKVNGIINEIDSPSAELNSTQSDELSKELNQDNNNKPVKDEDISAGSNPPYSDEILENELQNAEKELEAQNSKVTREETQRDISPESIPQYSNQILESDLETTLGEKRSGGSNPSLGSQDSKYKMKKIQGDNTSMESASTLGDQNSKDELESFQGVGKSAGSKPPFDSNNDMETTQGYMPVATPKTLLEDQKSNGVMVSTQAAGSSVTEMSSLEDQYSEDLSNSNRISSRPIQISNSNSSLKEPIITEFIRQMKEWKKKGPNTILLTFNMKKHTLTNTEMDQIVEDIYLDLVDIEPKCHIHPAHFKLINNTEISIEVMVDLPPEKEIFKMLERFPNVENNSVELVSRKGIDVDYLYSRIEEIMEYKLFMARTANSGQRIFLELPFKLKSKLGRSNRKFFVILLHEMTQYFNNIPGVKFENYKLIDGNDFKFKLLVVKISMRYSYTQAHEGLAAVPEKQGEKKRWNKELGRIWTIF
ncbi:uncharacterized protein LOC123683432 [Harmonia axyridis]|uniref:uncharacterized protein LOC123683432 n=1 Tax=Harmonia axyridis TaxID=115357 RepID=UPI001E277A4A|nr:uncharacterized protein LOC123683432 [Harmonia axyridis]